MNIVLILLLVAVVVVYLQRRKAPELAKPALYALVALVVLVSGGRLFCSRRRVPSHAEAVSIWERFEQAAVYRLGQAIAEDVPAGSTLLLIHEGDVDGVPRRNLDARLSALKQGLGADYPLHLAGPTEEESTDGYFVTDAMLRRFLHEHPESDAVVSLIGAPHFRTLPAPGAFPPVYCMGGREGDHWIPLLEREIVKAAVSHRRSGIDWDARPPRGMAPEALFDLRFRLIRAGEQDVLRQREE